LEGIFGIQVITKVERSLKAKRFWWWGVGIQEWKFVWISAIIVLSLHLLLEIQ
jgi:hypothetical protein